MVKNTEIGNWLNRSIVVFVPLKNVSLVWRRYQVPINKLLGTQGNFISETTREVRTSLGEISLYSVCPQSGLIPEPSDYGDNRLINWFVFYAVSEVFEPNITTVTFTAKCFSIGPREATHQRNGLLRDKGLASNSKGAPFNVPSASGWH